MIAPLANIYFYILEVFLCLLIILFAVYRLNFFDYLGNLNFIKKLNAKIRLNKLRTFKNSIWYIIKPSVSAVIKISGHILKIISIFLNETETKTRAFISKNITEAITFTSLVTRKVIISETNSLWSYLFAILVLIYFILTNF